MKIIFESARLLFREFTAEDTQLLYDLNSNPNVIKYVHEPTPTIESTTKVLQDIILPQYKLYNHGRWAVHLKSTSEFIGWCGLKYIKEADEIDLGYRFKEDFWGKGYATEAAKAAISYGFNTLRLKKIIAKALPENLGSLHVMEKCGMSYTGIKTENGLLLKVYELSNEPAGVRSQHETPNTKP
jgi:RimJ/RimL family protein N-acetyltransferase